MGRAGPETRAAGLWTTFGLAVLSHSFPALVNDSLSKNPLKERSAVQSTISV